MGRSYFLAAFGVRLGLGYCFYSVEHGKSYRSHFQNGHEDLYSFVLLHSPFGSDHRAQKHQMPSLKMQGVGGELSGSAV